MIKGKKILKNPRIAYLTCDQSDLSYPNLNDSVPIYAVIIYVKNYIF
jgi:hypothetical protein